MMEAGLTPCRATRSTSCPSRPATADAILPVPERATRGRAGSPAATPGAVIGCGGRKGEMR
jgi:hypothetical protein